MCHLSTRAGERGSGRVELPWATLWAGCWGFCLNGSGYQQRVWEGRREGAIGK